MTTNRDTDDLERSNAENPADDPSVGVRLTIHTTAEGAARIHKFCVRHEVRRQGAIGEFHWATPLDVEATSEGKARDAARAIQNAHGFETRGVRVIAVE
jgi:hypothetical protein